MLEDVLSTGREASAVSQVDAFTMMTTMMNHGG